MDETFDQFCTWFLKKYPNASLSEAHNMYKYRQEYREGIRNLVKEELIKYGLIDKNGRKPGVIYNGT